MTSSPGMLSRLRERYFASGQEAEARELQQGARDIGAICIADCPRGVTVTVSGTLRSITLRPSDEAVALEAEVFDGSGRLKLVWLGRRRIAGIEPGRGIVAHGRVTNTDGQPVIFNPRYSLKPMAGE